MVNRKHLLIGGLMAFVFSLFGITNCAFAATAAIEQKALANDIWRCYNGEGSNIASEVTEESIAENGINAVIKSTLTVPGTPEISNRGNLQTITCQQLMVGYEHDNEARYFNGLLFNGFAVDGRTTSKDNKVFSTKDMTKLGYKFQPDRTCIWLNYMRINDRDGGTSETLHTNYLCGNTPADVEAVEGKNNSSVLSIVRSGSVGIEIRSSLFKDSNGNSSIVLDSVLNQSADLKDLGSRLVAALAAFDGHDFSATDGWRYTVASANRLGMKETGKYVLDGDKTQATIKAINSLLGVSFKELSDFSPFSPAETYVLYWHYLADVYGISGSVVKCDYSESDEGFYANSSEWTDVPMVVGNEVKICFIDNGAVKNGSKTVNALNRLREFDGTKKNWKEMVEQLMGLKDDLNAKDISAAGDATATWTSEVDDCYKAGVESVSWLICPAINNMTYTAGGLDGVVDGMLQVDTGLYSDSSNAHAVWEVIRNISNIVMIIILLVIVFSQLTGFGIDNYGIKKMLPKLIAMAIVINLSFILCELAVDLSNIAGVGLRSVFGAIGQGLDGSSGGRVGDELNSLVAMAGAAGGIAGTGASAVIGAIGVVSGPMIILMLFVCLLGVISALVLFFFMIGARMILVVMCIGIAPLACVCYILPNTRKMFDRWKTVFIACLIVYPICGAMLGISELIRGVAWGSGVSGDAAGIAMRFVALIAPYLPFFIMPSLLKSSLAAVGNIGAALTNAGNAVRRGVNRGADAIKNTEAYKSANDAIARERQKTNANRIIGSLGGMNKEKMNPHQRRRLARAYDVIERNKRDDLSAEGALMTQKYSDLNEKELENAWVSKFEENSDDLEAFTNYYYSRYGGKALNKMADRIAGYSDFETNEKRQGALRVLQSAMIRNPSMGSDMRKGNSDLYSMLSSGGTTGVGKDRKYQNLGHFSADSINTNEIDWANQSKGSLKRAVDSGALDANKIQRLLDTDNPAIRSALLSDDGKLDVLQAALYAKSNGIQFDFDYHSDDIQKVHEHEQKIADLAKAYRASQNDNNSNNAYVGTTNATGGSRSSGDGLDIPHFANGSNSSSGEAEIPGFMNKR